MGNSSDGTWNRTSKCILSCWANSQGHQTIRLRYKLTGLDSWRPEWGGTHLQAAQAWSIREPQCIMSQIAELLHQPISASNRFCYLPLSLHHCWYFHSYCLRCHLRLPCCFFSPLAFSLCFWSWLLCLRTYETSHLPTCKCAASFSSLKLTREYIFLHLFFWMAFMGLNFLITKS